MQSDTSDLIDGLAQTAFVVTAALGRVAADNGLSLTQLRLLAILRDRQLRMSELADYMGLEKSSVSGLVDRAAARGLLERVASETDRRAVEVRMTVVGQAAAVDVFGQVETALTPLTTGLALTDQRSLSALLRGMLAASDPPA